MKRLVLSLLVLATLANANMSASVDAQVRRGNRQVPTTGYINPTVSTFNGGLPLVACSSSCSTALVNQNTDTLQVALNQASSGTHPWIYLPPADYPIARGGVAHDQLYGVRLQNQSGVVIYAPGAVLRASGDLGTGGYSMFEVTGGSSNVRIHGLGFSQRDLTHSPIPEQTHMLQFGDAQHVTTDNIQVIGCSFTEGKGGDAIRILGGNKEIEAVQRVVIANNWINGKRSGIAFQHGSSMFNIINNTFGPDGTDQEVDHEPTSKGGNHYENVIGNNFLRPAGTVPLNTVGGSSSGTLSVETSFSNVWMANVMPHSGTITGLRMAAHWFIANEWLNASTSGVAKGAIGFFGAADDTWFTNNWVNQITTDTTPTQALSWTGNSGFRPHNVWVRDNHVDMWRDGTGIYIGETRDFFVIGNHVTYHSPTASSFTGIVGGAEGGTDGAGRPMDGSGIIANNRVIRGLQIDGVTPAGVIDKLAAWGPNISTNTSFGFGVIRDNFVDGATKLMTLSTIGATFPEGLPMISGNQIINNTSTNLTGSYVVETTPDTEVISTSSAALSPVRHATFINTTCGGFDADTLPDALVDGFIKTVNVYAACTTTGTLTPSAFGDGTSISWSVSATTRASVRLAWDAADSTWRLIDKTAGITINP